MESLRTKWCVAMALGYQYMVLVGLSPADKASESHLEPKVS